MAMNRQTKRMMQRQGQLAPDGTPARRAPQPRPAPRPVKERTGPGEYARQVRAEPDTAAPDVAAPDGAGTPDDAEAVSGGDIVITEDELLGGSADDYEDVDEEPVRESPYDRPGSWYVVHTYAGYENKVKSNLESRIASMNMEDRIFEVVIPMEDVIEFKAGKKVLVPKKVFPGYLPVRRGLDGDSWTG